MIAFHLKSVLPDIISPTQSAFVPGRLITENSVLAYESMHAMKNKKKGKWGSVKLCMHKAYDRVAWNFFAQYDDSLGISCRVCKSFDGLCSLSYIQDQI